MSTDWLMAYNWLAAIVYFAATVLIVKVGAWFVFKDPGAQRMRTWNNDENMRKFSEPKYPPIVKANIMLGKVFTFVLVAIVAPFFMTLESVAAWRYLVDLALILLIYDFVYYLTHRFLFHGNGYFRKVHGLHHQARDISLIDSSYVHPTETIIGSSLYALSVVATGLLMGDIHVVSAVLAYLIWTQVNALAHAKFDLDYFPFKTINYLSSKHAVHHVNMNKGNYSTVLLVYDWMFGTFENE